MKGSTRSAIVFFLLFLLTLGLLYCVSYFKLFVFPINELQALWDGVENKEKAKFLLELAKFIATFGGAIVVLWNVKISQENRNLTEEKIDAETFAKGIDQLGKDESITTRLGGVFTLEQVAINSERYYPVVVNILTSLLKEINQDDERFCSKRLVKPPVFDSQKEYREVSHEFLTVFMALNRLHKLHKVTKHSKQKKGGWTKKNHRKISSSLIDMRNLDMNSTFLESADLSRFDLSGSNFSNSFLMSAQFTDSIMENVNFSGSSLGSSDFEGTILEFADFSDADLSSANLKFANLSYSILKRANLSDVQTNNLTRLEDADVAEATLKGCNLSQQQEAQLTHIDLAHR